MFKVKEIFSSIQGEGFYTGRPAVFLRFAGCNLWNGKLKDKQNAIDEINKYVSLNNIEIVDLRFLNKKIYVKTKQNEKIVMKKEGK